MGESPFSPQGGADGGEEVVGHRDKGGTVLVMLTGAYTHSHEKEGYLCML